MKSSSMVLSKLLARTLLSMLAVFVFAAHSQTRDTERTELDQLIKGGLEALRENEWNKARSSFEKALASQDANKRASPYLIGTLRLPDEDPDAVPADRDEAALTEYRHAMGTRQALLTFLAFTSQLEGDSDAADRYLDQVFGMLGPLWGTSWDVFTLQIQSLFHLQITAKDSSNYGRYLYLSGVLLRGTNIEMARRLAEESQKLRPKDAQIAATLASIYLNQQHTAKAIEQAERSLALEPDQERVLIDLATAKWVSGEFDSAKKSALAAKAIAPKLPGPHMILAMIALQAGELTLAKQHASEALELSDRHPYYLTIMAAVFESTKDSSAADRSFNEAWGAEPPSIAQFERWFTKHKPLALIEAVRARAANKK
jgi:Tfp pilus assembly protein PilF